MGFYLVMPPVMDAKRGIAFYGLSFRGVLAGALQGLGAA